RIGCSGTSFGTFFGTILTAHEPRIRAFAAMSVCHEPGCHTIFQEASPTFKKRFMYMSGITDESEFDRFRKTITWESHAEKIRAPYLVVAGEYEELSPVEHSERLLKMVKGPKQMVVYQESRHSVGNVPAANLGPFPQTLVADWLAERLAGKPFGSEHLFVRSRGEGGKTPPLRDRFPRPKRQPTGRIIRPPAFYPLPAMPVMSPRAAPAVGVIPAGPAPTATRPATPAHVLDVGRRRLRNRRQSIRDRRSAG